MVRWIKQAAPAIASSAAFEKFVSILEQSERDRRDVFRVLTYHRVDTPGAHPSMDPGLISASPEAFEAQVRYLAANYEVVSTADLAEAIQNPGKEAFPPRAVLITFDDAYRDFEAHAWPILKQYRAPVTLFVPTAFPDHPERWFWWDRLFYALNTTEKGDANTPVGRLSLDTAPQRTQALKHLKGYIKTLPNEVALEEVEELCNELGVVSQENLVLGWESLRTLAKEGVTLGAHTRTHPIMNHISFEDMQNEVKGSMQDLQREIGQAPNVFAYPSGFHNDDVVKAVKQAGVALAFTTERGINQVGQTDPFRLRRINIGARTTIPLLRAQMLSMTANFYSSSRNM